MTIPAFVVDVAAGTLSGALVTYLPLRREKTLSTGNAVNVTGTDNTTVVDQSSSHYWDITHHTTTTTVTATPSRSAQSGSDDALVLVGLAGLIAVVAFLFAWPAALGFLLGSCVVTTVVYTRATSSSVLRPAGLSSASIAHSAICLAVTTATCAFAFFSSSDGQGLVNLERELSARFPHYSSSIPTRWDVLTHHTSDVFSLIGWHGALVLLAQVGGLIMCALMTALLGMRALGAVSLCQQAAGRRVGRFRQNLGTRLMTERPHADIAITLLVGAIALFLASGLATHVFVAGSEANGTAAGLSDPSASISAKGPR